MILYQHFFSLPILAQHESSTLELRYWTEQGSVGWERVVAGELDSLFQAYAGQALSPDSAHWGLLELRNASGDWSSQVLRLGGKRHADYADFYVLDSLGRHRRARGGYFVPRAERDIIDGLGAKLNLRMGPGEELRVYFRVRNISGFSPRFSPVLLDEPDFQAEIKSRNWMQGLVQGILWIMFLYNLLIFIFGRDRVYFYYSTFILGMAVNFLAEGGLLNESLLSERPTLDIYFFIVATGVANMAYFQFLRLFLQCGTRYPGWDKAHRVLIALKGVEMLALVGVAATSFHLPTVLNVSNLLNMAGLVYGMFFLVRVVRGRDKLGAYYVLGAGLLLVGSLSALFFLVTGKALAFDPRYLLQGGTVGEVLFFSLGLAYRIRLNEREKQEAQASLIEQLTENELLQTKVNRELEQKVGERTREIEEQKAKLAAQSQKITDSIVYAKKIQQAVLSPAESFAGWLPEHFIFHRPKDIVSGDFYYVKAVGDKLVWAAADCTGHGVPGAFMSMLGVAFLNEIVAQDPLDDAGRILRQLRDKVKLSLNQQGQAGEAKDGMDIGLCVLEPRAGKGRFAGAYNPMLMVREGVPRLLRGDRMPIGIHVRERTDFTNHEFELLPGDQIYLFSDGYTDQMSAATEKKFTRKRLVETLLGVEHLPMAEQKQALGQAIEQWLDGAAPIDDMLVMGLRL